MSQRLVGTCGKPITCMCYPLFEDDLCVGCQFNGWTEIETDREEELFTEALKDELE